MQGTDRPLNHELSVPMCLWPGQTLVPSFLHTDLSAFHNTSCEQSIGNLSVHVTQSKLWIHSQDNMSTKTAVNRHRKLSIHKEMWNAPCHLQMLLPPNDNMYNCNPNVTYCNCTHCFYTVHSKRSPCFQSWFWMTLSRYSRPSQRLYIKCYCEWLHMLQLHKYWL